MEPFEQPQPSNKTKAEVAKVAEAYAKEVDFMPGDRIEPLIERLGGCVTYLRSLESIEATDGSLLVYGPRNFEIKVSAFTGPERDLFTIAHELGHYVLHSDRGNKRIKAARFGSDRVEWEANWFAAGFLMPEEDFRLTCAKCERNPSLVAARYMVSPKAAQVRMLSLSLAPL